MTLESSKIGKHNLEEIMAPIQMDLVAYYSMLVEDVQKRIAEAGKEGKTPDECIRSVIALLEE